MNHVLETRIDEDLQKQTRTPHEPQAKIVLIFSFALLLVEEILAVYVNVILSLFLALLGVFITAALPYAIKRAALVKASLQCFSLIFLTRVATAVVPALILPPALLLATVYSVILGACAMYILDRRLNVRSLGFRFSNVSVQAFGGFGLGVIMGVTEFAILSSDMKTYLLYPGFSVTNFAYVAILMFFFVALGEETLFRGLAQTSLEKELGNQIWAMLFVSSVFAIMHLGYVTSLGKILELIYVFGASTAIGYSFMKTRSLILPLIAHGIANTILFGVIPYLL